MTDMEMEPYYHLVQYYETDKMGVTHHSNYIRWMEEARVDFLDKIGWSYVRMEEMGLMSPVLDVNCRYKRSTTFGDKIKIIVRVKEFKGLKFWLTYDMFNEKDGKPCASGESCHCFMDSASKPIFMQKEYPQFYEALKPFILEN